MMRSFLFFVLFVLCVGAVGAQERLITEAEYNVARAKAFSALQNGVFREKKTIEDRDSVEKPWKRQSYTVEENIRPDRSHTHTTRFIAGRTEQVSEIIRIGETVYIKQPDGAWRTDHYRLGVATGTNSANAAPPINEFKHLGYSTIIGQKAALIQKTTSFELKVEENIIRPASVERIWMDVNGRILKMEWESSNVRNSPFPFMRSTSVYEFDSTIKVEPPIK